MKKAPIILGVIGAVVVILAGVLGFAVFPKVVENQVENELQLVRGTNTWYKWTEIENPVYMNFYIFNVTNPDEVEAGTAPPNLQQLGPYAYRQRRQKLNPWSDSCKETVKYEQKITYYFDPEKSGANRREDDLVNIVNVPFVSVLKGVLDMYMEVNPEVAPAIVSTVGELLRRTERLIRRNVTVGDLTFNGFDVSAYDLSMFAGLLPEEFDGFRFGIYKGKNESTDGQFEVYSGATGAERFGQIKSWNGESSLAYWNSIDGESTVCNSIAGSSDGSIFHPFFEKSDTIDIFNTDLCRSLKLTFKEEVTVKDIDAYRFSPPPKELEGPVDNPDHPNACYCIRENKTECQSGIIDIGTCRGGAPIILSAPHFLDGYPHFAEAMGLEPRRELHETTIDIEPRTGLLLEAHKRIQVNLEVRVVGPYATVPQYVNQTEHMIFPVLWIDEEAGICDYDVDDFKSRVEKPIKAVNIVRWVFIGVGAAIIVAAIGLAVFNK